MPDTTIQGCEIEVPEGFRVKSAERVDVEIRVTSENNAQRCRWGGFDVAELFVTTPEHIESRVLLIGNGDLYPSPDCTGNHEASKKVQALTTIPGYHKLRLVARVAHKEVLGLRMSVKVFAKIWEDGVLKFDNTYTSPDGAITRTDEFTFIKSGASDFS